MSKPRRVIFTILRVIGAALGLTVAFVLAAVSALLLHLGRPATRRAVATQVSSILKSTFEGETRIERIGSLGLGGLDGIRASVRDPSGLEVLRVDGVGARVSSLAAAKSALFGKGPIAIDIPSAWVGHVDANLDTDAEGNLRIANAFVPKAAPAPPKRNEPPGRGVLITMPKVRLAHAWAHGSPSEGLLVDAELAELAARVKVDPDVTRATLDHVRLVTRSLPRGANPRGLIHGTFATPAVNGQGFDLEAFFDGESVGIPTTLEAKMVDRHVDVRLDARDDTGSRAAVAEIAIHEPFAVHAEVHGDLPEIEGDLNVALGKATAVAKAKVEAAKKTRIVADLSARDVNAASLSPSAPSTRVGLDARADVTLADGGSVFGKASIDTLPGTVDGRTIPRAEIRGVFEGLAAQIRARVLDPNMPTEVALDVTPRGESGDARTLTGTVRSYIAELGRLPVVGEQLAGSAEVSAFARVSFPEARIEESRVNVGVTRVKADSLSVGTVDVTARAAGTVEQPVIDAELHARNLLTGTLPLASVDARAHVERAGDVITVREAKIAAVRPASEKVTATARLVRLTGQNVRASGVEITGVGDPVRAELTKQGREIRGQIDAPKIDLALVARLLGKEKDLELSKGTLGLKGDGQLRGGTAKAKIHAEVRDLAMRSVRHGEATLDGSIDGRDVDLDLIAKVGETGQVALRTEKVRLGGALDDPKAWRDIAGKVHLTANVDMARAARFVPEDQMPVADLRGALTVQGRVGRDSPDAAPEIQFHTRTVGLGFAGRAGDPEHMKDVKIEKASPVRASAFDVGIDVRNDGKSGLTNVAFLVTDPKGVIVAADAKAILPYDELVRDSAHAQDILLSAPFNARISVPPRRLDELPSLFAPAGVGGAIAAEIQAGGSVVDPLVHVDMRARNLKSGSASADVDADADVTFDYDGKVAGFSAKLGSSGKELADVSAQASIHARDLLARSKSGKGLEDLPWTASAKARLASFPLESVPQLTERRVRGNVSGEFALEGLHENAHMKGQLDFERLGVGEAEYPRGRVLVDTADNRLVAQVRLEQKDGNLDLEASSGITWGAELAPTLDDGKPITAKLLARSFRASALQPFIENAVPALDGRIDANATAQLIPGKPGAQLNGTVDFRDGKVLVAAIGEELRGVKASVRLHPDGTIRVTDVGAKGTQGEVHADANVKLDGTRLADATANVRIPSDKPLALAVQGSPIGQLAGTITLKAKQSPDGKDTSVTVEIPRLGVELPQVTKTGVQALETKENIHAGVYRSRRRFVELPLDESHAKSAKEKEGEKAADTSRLGVDVRLGRITIERGNQLRVEVTGDPKIEIAGGETKITGQVSVARGWVDVQGKKFEIEKGIVTFNGESPPDPVIVATAAWTAADGSRIYADFVGPVATGKVTLRSEPPRPQNEILATILFGTADGANPAPPSQQSNSTSTTKTAVGLGGGYLAQGLTEALDDLGGVQATARIDTTESNNPRPELSFQVSPKVSVGFAHVIGTPPITEPDRNYANVEYRFRRNWSLETTFGDRGSTLFDAIWQKRY